MKRNIPIAVVRGGGELGTGVACSLWQAGYRVICAELRQPLAIRRSVAFASALYDGRIVIAGIQGERIGVADEAIFLWARKTLPVIIDPDARIIAIFQPELVVDAIGAGAASGTTLAHAPCVIGLGAGFNAGQDCHAVIETRGGPDAGRVIWLGAVPDAGVREASVDEARHLVRAEADGQLRGRRAIGDRVQAGEALAAIDMSPVITPVGGIVRGLLHDGLRVGIGMTIADIDPAGQPRDCYSISGRAQAVGDAAATVARTRH